MKILYLSESLINELYNNNSAMELTNNRVAKIVNIKGKSFVCFGSCSTGANGVEYLLIHECVSNEQFEGETYNYETIGKLVDSGQIERGSHLGQKFSHKGKEFVFVGEPITAYPIQEAKQLDLF